MANTYTQIHVQIVYSVQYRQAQIGKEWKEDLYRYITGIVKNNNHKLLQINGMPDHVHILIGLRPAQALSDLVKQIKQDSSKWINKNKYTKYRFAWQSGYGAFSYTKRDVSEVINYIRNQDQHHHKSTFLEEYERMLQMFDVNYDGQYIFQPLE